MKKIIIAFGILLLMMISAGAFTYNQISAPASYSTSASASINISGGINITAFPYLTGRAAGENGTYANVSNHTIGVRILNKSSSSGTYGILASSAALTVNAHNSSGNTNNFWNFTATLKEGRNWIRLNFTNVSRNDAGGFGGSITDEVIIDIDTELYRITLKPFSKINFSLDTGDINISGNLHIGSGGNITMIQGSTRYTCGPNGTGKPMICV